MTCAHILRDRRARDSIAVEFLEPRADYSPDEVVIYRVSLGTYSHIISWIFPFLVSVFIFFKPQATEADSNVITRSKLI